MSVRVQSDPRLTFGNASVLVEGQYFSGAAGRQWDVSPDGQRFLMIKEGGGDDTVARLIVVQNWTQELKRLVPVE